MGFTCLNNWIGLRGCNGNTSDSGVYVNDLPGIDLRIADEAADEEQVNFSGVWTAVQKRGLNKFATDVTAYFAKRYQLKTLSQGNNLGRKVDIGSVTALAPEYRGITIELNNADDQLVMSNLQVIYLQKVSLYLPAIANPLIKVFDLDTWTELYSSTLTGAAGWNDVNINTTFTARRIFVCYNSTAVNSVDLDITEVMNFECFCNCKSELHGAVNDIASPGVITEGTNSFGLSAVYSVQCKYDNLVCNNREVFTQMLNYCLGIELLSEIIYSPRLNRWTTTDARKLKVLRQELEARYKGGSVTDGDTTMSFDGELPTIIDGIRLNMSDCCLECNQNIMFKDANV